MATTPTTKPPGVTFTPVFDDQPSYSIGREPCAAESSPWVVRDGVPEWRDGIPIALQCSRDLIAWDTLVATKMPPGVRVDFVDTSEAEQMFYRLVPSL